MNSTFKNTTSLDFSTKNGLYFLSNTEWKRVLPYKTQKIVEKIAPFAFFCFKNEPLIFFFHNPKDEIKIHQQCWNFNKTPIVIFFRGQKNPISDKGNELIFQLDEKIDIYNGFDIIENQGLLSPLSNAKISDFSYWNIVSGKVWETYASAFKNENKVDNRLLKNIGVGRSLLINSIKQDNNIKEAQIIANRVLGRLIFTRYLIDRKVKINFKESNYLSRVDLTNIILDYTELYDLFTHLQNIFNGDLFPFVKSVDYEKNTLKASDLEIISNLFKGDDILSGQRSLFHLYDFSIIPIELVSNIYEYFMGDEKQDKNKAFYTPPFLVDYLVNETIEPYLKHQDTWHCTTLDPACGSGIFLVETLRRIIVKYKTVNPNIEFQNIDKYKKALLNLLETNIYGIDKDGDAIDVAIFSLYVTLLDFISDPKDIEGFKFRSLLGKNFFIGDFFPYKDKETNKEVDLSKIFKSKDIKLNFIIGNPPWGRVKDSPYMDYAKQRLKKEPEEQKRLQQLFPTNINGKKRTIRLVENNEIAQAFLLRTSDFSLENNTTCALLVTSKVLHNGQSDVFRNYLLTNTQVEKVVDFSAIRKHIFSKPKGAKDTIGPCAFLIYNWSKNNKKNIIQHYSPKLNRLYKVFKILTIQKFDYKKIAQKQFIKYDWAWKIFLYGNILDFKFVKFLKEHFDTINNLIQDNERFVLGRGVEPSGEIDIKTEHLRNEILIDTKKDLQRYLITLNTNTVWKVGRGKNRKVWNRLKAHRGKKDKFDAGLFDGNSLLIAKGLDNNFHSVSAYTDKKAIFRDSITGIKAKRNQDAFLIKNLIAYLNSTYFSYYIFNTGSSTGIEREQVQNKERFSLPIVENNEIGILVDKISEAKSNLNKFKSENHLASSNEINLFNSINGKQYIDKVLRLEEKIEEEIYKSFNFTNEEKALINFSQEISIPLFKGEKKPFEKVTKEQLTQYSKVFENYFSQVFNKPNKYFQVDVFESEFMIAIQFKIVQNQPDKIFNYRKDEKQLEILKMLSVVAFEEITDKVFIQKDVKIINKKSFWVIKPNEYKCWHEAVAYLDLDEFIPALLTPKKTAVHA
jgi:hypothetical protein